MSFGTCGAAALVLALGCEARAPAAIAAGPDKRALYADAGLVPTRAGERAREELALAGSVAAALRARAEVTALAVEVRLPAAGDPGAAVIAGELSLDVPAVTRIAEGVLGPWSAGRVQVELAPARVGAPERPEAPGSLGWPLALALVGLGASAGVSIERLRQRPAQRARRR